MISAKKNLKCPGEEEERNLRPGRRQEEVPRGPRGLGGRRRAQPERRSAARSSRRALEAKRKKSPAAARRKRSS